jgi:hypothetical protein
VSLFFAHQIVAKPHQELLSSMIFEHLYLKDGDFFPNLSSPWMGNTIGTEATHQMITSVGAGLDVIAFDLGVQGGRV